MFNDIEAKCLGQRAFQGTERPSSFVLGNPRNSTGGHSLLSSLHIIWIGDEQVRGVEKPRDTYYLDETEAQRDGTAFRAPLQVATGELVSLMSQFLAFCLQNDIF